MDNFKIIYMILTELENHIGEEPEFEKHAYLKDCPCGIFSEILIMLRDERCISGLDTLKYKNREYVKTPYFARITLRGMEYLHGNPLMIKVKEELRESGEII